MGDMFRDAMERRKQSSRALLEKRMGQHDQLKASEEDETDGQAFEFAFGFIPTFNVGTALGVDNAIARITMDILLDPFGIALAAFSGGATVVGKAASASAKLARAGNRVSHLAHLSEAEKLTGLDKIYRAATVASKNPGLLDPIRKAAAAQDVQGVIKETKKLGKLVSKSEIDREIMEALPTTKQLKSLQDVIKKQVKANLSETTIPLLASKRIEQAERGQRALLKVQVPFMSQTEKVLIQGNKVWNKFDDLWPLSPYAVAPGFAGVKTLDDIVGTLYDTRIAEMQEQKAIAFVKNERRVKVVEAAAPGGIEKGLTHLATFIREKAGMTLARAEALGLDKLFEEIGIKAQTVTKNIHGKSVTSKVFTDVDLLKLSSEMGWDKAVGYLNKRMDTHYETFLKFMNDAELGIEVGELEDYIQHIYKIGKGDGAMVKGLATKMKDTGAFQKKRAFDTLFDAEVLGNLEPATTDALELMTKYHEAAIRIMQNRQFYKNVRQIEVLDDIGSLASLGKSAGVVGSKVDDLGEAMPILLDKDTYRGLSEDAQKAFTPITEVAVQKAINNKLKIGQTAGFSLREGTTGGTQLKVLKKQLRESMVETIKKSAGFVKSSGKVQAKMIKVLDGQIDDIVTEIIEGAGEAVTKSPKSGTANKKLIEKAEKEIQKIVSAGESGTFVGKKLIKKLEKDIQDAKTIGAKDAVETVTPKAGTTKDVLVKAAQKVKDSIGADELFETISKGKNLKAGTMGRVIKDAISKEIGALLKASKPQDIFAELPEGEFIRRELMPYLEVLTSRPITNNFTNALEQFNAVAKSIALAGSLFHSLSLTESVFAVGGRKGLQFAGKQGFGIPYLSQYLVKRGVSKRIVDFTQQEIVKAGRYVNLDMSSDVRIDMLNKFMDETSTFTGRFPGGGVLDGILKYPKSIIRANNEALWENFHVPMKVWAFNNKMIQLMKDPRFANLSRDEIARGAGAFIDKAFGGVNWERVMVSQQSKQAWHWMLLAPDWTYANMAVFTALDGTSPSQFGKKLLKFPITKDVEDLPIFGGLKGDDVQIALANQYWKNAGFAFFMSSQLANYALNGHSTFENAPGFAMDIKLPWQDEEGRDQYAKIGKQLREPMRWMTDPFSIFGSKLSPGFQTVVEQLSAHSTNGFPTEFATQRGRLPMTAMESVPGRVKAISAKFIPFSLQGKQIFFALPTKSYSQTSAVRAIKGAVEDNDAQAVKELMKLSVANGHNLGRVRGIVKQETKDPNGLLGQSVE